MSTVKAFLKRKISRKIYNKVLEVIFRLRIATVDKVLFPEFKITESEFSTYRQDYPFLVNDVRIKDIENSSVRYLMTKWYDWTQEEFVLDLNRPCIIEPDYGWAVVSPNKLLFYSLGISRTWFLKKPSLFKFLKNKKKILRTQVVVSLRDSGEENYFHCFNDVLAKIPLIQGYTDNWKAIPFLVSERLWNKPYFKFYIENAPMVREVNWLIQRDEYVLTERAFFCKPLTHRIDIWKRVFANIEPFKNFKNQQRRIFVSRGANRSRSLINVEDITKVLGKYSVEVIDPDFMSFIDQVRVFAEASLVIGIHGAGLTNLYFSNPPCTVVEIFPDDKADYLPFHYLMIADMKGLSYNALVGRQAAAGLSDGFYLDPTLLATELDRYEKAFA